MFGVKQARQTVGVAGCKAFYWGAFVEMWGDGERRTYLFNRVILIHVYSLFPVDVSNDSNECLAKCSARVYCSMKG